MESRAGSKEIRSKATAGPRLEMLQGASVGTETRKGMGKRLRRTTDVPTESYGPLPGAGDRRGGNLE